MDLCLRQSANLTNANLFGADLFGADLTRAQGLTRKQLETARNVDWERVPADLPEE